MPESRSNLAVPPVETSSTPSCGKFAGEIYQSGFVGDTENGALNFRHETSEADDKVEKKDFSRQYPVASIQYPVKFQDLIILR